ncbi:alkyl hydroperoxide reductase [Microbacterium sp. No. 7]|nr:alkyl hydroperoxide reductase [Microbacterium sp. No. 7]
MTARRRTSRAARVLASVAALALAVTLSACSADDGIAGAYTETNDKGFVAGDGTFQEIAAADRGEPVAFTGTGIDGETISSADYEGQVLVLNFWFAGCAPCRTEAPILRQVHEETSPDAAFLGVNIYDGPEQARAFETEFGIEYPSLLMVKDAELKLSFITWTQVNAAPTTLVLDKQGRVAARYLGAVREDYSLRTVVQDLIAEPS